MKEYIDIDKNVIVYDTHGRRCEVTVRHILEKNHGEYEIDDVVPVVRGKWKLGGYGQISDADEKWYDKYLTGGFLYCSVCKGRASVQYNFCPNCGADMREES